MENKTEIQKAIMKGLGFPTKKVMAMERMMANMKDYNLVIYLPKEICLG